MYLIPSEIESVIERQASEGASLISILEAIQEKYHYLPQNALILISERLNLPLSQVYSVATFYNVFSLTPQGEHLISVCLGTACHVKGGEKILEKLGRELNIESGETTKDFQFTLEKVRCIGCCALAPVIRIDENTYGHLVQEKIPRILKKYKKD